MSTTASPKWALCHGCALQIIRATISPHLQDLAVNIYFTIIDELSLVDDPAKGILLSHDQLACLLARHPKDQNMRQVVKLLCERELIARIPTAPNQPYRFFLLEVLQ